MGQHGWPDVPEDTRAQIERLTVLLRAHIGDDLVGIYLHGSLAMGCWNPSQSNVDLLVVAERSMPISTKWRVAQVLLRLSRAPSPIEVSFLMAPDLERWSHPTPFDLHYSEDHRLRFEHDLRSGGWKEWGSKRDCDADLAGHVTVTRARGICLWGKPIDEVFPDVPAGDYLASILADVEWARGREEIPVDHRLLNLCRVWAYVRDGLVVSKDEGGEWALDALPAGLRGPVAEALDVYRGEAAPAGIEYERVDETSGYMRRNIEELAGARTGSPADKEE